jgi:hypothetical protein
MKINVRCSEDFERVEYHFSDGNYTEMALEEAKLLSEILNRLVGICYDLSDKERQKISEVPSFNVQCSEFLKEF